jgi:hypothetical protein
MFKTLYVVLESLFVLEEDSHNWFLWHELIGSAWISPRAMQPRHNVDCLPLPSDKVRNRWKYTVPVYASMAWIGKNIAFYLITRTSYKMCVVVLQKVLSKLMLFAFFSGDCDLEWCDGLGMFIILISLLYLGLVYYHIIKKLFGRRVYRSIMVPVSKWWNRLMTRRWPRLMLECLCSLCNSEAELSGCTALIHAEYWTA